MPKPPKPKKNDNPRHGKKAFVEGVDYYIDKGLYVFTGKYLLERGYCCGNRCRHCPYGELDAKCSNIGR